MFSVTSALISSEAVVRLCVFLGVFGAMMVFELWSPRLERAELTGALKARRWATNLATVVLSSLVLRVIFPGAAVGAAIWAESHGWGLLRMIGAGGFPTGLLAFVILDFAVWAEHLASHKFPLLWRIHRVHHADQGFDVTTGLRFHPLEIVLSMVWKASVIVALGAPVVAVLIFEIVLNASAMFSHSNTRLPLWLDVAVRPVFVTPDMHRVHHSVVRRETDSNYGFNFSIWDRIFGTYIAQPEAGHHNMTIGLSEYRGPQTSNLLWLLRLPFRLGSTDISKN